MAALLATAVWIWHESRSRPLAFLRWLPDLNWQHVGSLVVLLLAVLLVAGTNYFQALRAYEWQVALRLLHVATGERRVRRGAPAGEAVGGDATRSAGLGPGVLRATAPAVVAGTPA